MSSVGQSGPDLPYEGMGRARLRLAAVLVVLVPLGFATKLYGGPGAGWVGGYAGGLLYVMFWILLALTARPTLPPWRTALVVLLITTALEFLQLWHPPPLQAVRATFLGQTLLGSHFAWGDFPWYLAGAAAGGAMGARLAPYNDL